MGRKGKGREEERRRRGEKRRRKTMVGMNASLLVCLPVL
jgi:hypothetical protein